MDPQFFLYKNSAFRWRRFGSGPLAVLCFHGYGEEGSKFAFLEKEAGDRYSFFAPDLPFHGETVWREKDPFTVEDLLALSRGILPTQHCILMGYSLGGRTALSLFETGALDVSKLVLLAPDGLKVNSWYWFATQTMAGRKLFRFTMNHPGWFFLLLNIFNRLRLVNPSVFKFVSFYIGNAGAREILYQRWISLRKLRPRLEKIRQRIRDGRIPTRLIYGCHDRIILSSVGERFCRKTGSCCQVRVIASGHQVLHEKHGAEILQAMES